MNNKRHMRKRINFINALFSMCILMIVIRLGFIQLGNESEKYVSIALNQYNLQYRTSNLNYRILDSNNEDLINYSTKYMVEIKSNMFKKFNNNIETEKVFTFISILKNYNEDFDLIKKFEENPNYNFKFEIDKYTYDKLKTLDDINGVHLYEYNEFNPQKAWSIENILVNEIKEKSTEDAYHQYIINNLYPLIDFNNSFSGEKVVNEENNNLKLTIDKKLNYGINEILLESEYEKFEDIAVSISEVSTGKIKALTQKNEYNPNIMLGSTTVGYVPGSIFKLVVAETVIDSGVFLQSDIFSCDNSRYQLCKDHTHGNLTIEEALAVSCNNIFAEIGRFVGWDFILNYAKEQGIFQKILGFSDLREIDGSFASPKEYEDGPLFLSMGQNMLIEPLQSLGIINTIINKGIHKELNLIDSIVNENGETVKNFKYKSNRVFKESTADSIKKMLINTVENGTGKNIYLEGIEIGAKTGTTERYDGENYVSDGWVLGYFKHRNRYYSMCVFVKNINEEGQYGGNTAGPIFKKIVEYFVDNF